MSNQHMPRPPEATLSAHWRASDAAGAPGTGSGRASRPSRKVREQGAHRALAADVGAGLRTELARNCDLALREVDDAMGATSAARARCAADIEEVFDRLRDECNARQVELEELAVRAERKRLAALARRRDDLEALREECSAPGESDAAGYDAPAAVQALADRIAAARVPMGGGGALGPGAHNAPDGRDDRSFGWGSGGLRFVYEGRMEDYAADVLARTGLVLSDDDFLGAPNTGVTPADPVNAGKARSEGGLVAKGLSGVDYVVPPGEQLEFLVKSEMPASSAPGAAPTFGKTARRTARGGGGADGADPDAVRQETYAVEMRRVKMAPGGGAAAAAALDEGVLLGRVVLALQVTGFNRGAVKETQMIETGRDREGTPTMRFSKTVMPR